jgi:hypothetical protein
MAIDNFGEVKVTFDAPTYTKGATMALTVTGQNRHRAWLLGALSLEDVTIVSVTDSAGRTYTPKPGSNGHSVTAVA